MFSHIFSDIWRDPQYRFLIIAVSVQISFVCFGIILLLIQDFLHQRGLKKVRNLSHKLGSELLNVLEERKNPRQWLAKAGEYPLSVIRDYLEPFLLEDTSHYRGKVILIYRKLGLLEQDIRDSRSIFRRKRLRAMRRLLTVATSEERQILLDRRKDGYAIRILGAFAIGRTGTAEDIYDMLGEHMLSTRLMEEPLYALFSSLSENTMQELMTYWSRFVCPRIRRIILVSMARFRNDSWNEHCDKSLKEAAVHSSIEVRIGACMAAGALANEKVIPLLLGLVVDKDWEVRAHASRALGNTQSDDAIEPLVDRLSDQWFWVRQNAAAALRILGAKGRARLAQVSADGEERFAADAARQELDIYEVVLHKGGVVQ